MSLEGITMTKTMKLYKIIRDKVHNYFYSQIEFIFKSMAFLIQDL